MTTDVVVQLFYIHYVHLCNNYAIVRESGDGDGGGGGMEDCVSVRSIYGSTGGGECRQPCFGANSKILHVVCRTMLSHLPKFGWET